jgi:hypothetical protein
MAVRLRLPSAGAAGPRLAPGGDRLFGRPPLDVLGQDPARRVSVGRLLRHRLLADRLQRRVDGAVELSRRPELAATDGIEDVGHLAGERRHAGQQAVERGAQAVDV